MTIYARCRFCGYAFPAHTEHPYPPPHQMPGTGQWCAGTSHEALTEVS